MLVSDRINIQKSGAIITLQKINVVELQAFEASLHGVKDVLRDTFSDVQHAEGMLQVTLRFSPF